MLYKFLKILSSLAIKIYCRKIVINKPELLAEKGPLLLACNHPNSFLDSVIIDTLFHQPVWSLARGDVFKRPFYIKLLTSLKILPVYRTSEGVENLSENYKTFEACIGLFRENGIVTIFSEGKCINEWHLRPLKKGTARLAIRAWEENIPLKILPVGINYSSFRSFGKNVFLHFGNIITSTAISIDEPDGTRNRVFNEKLNTELSQLVFEIPANDIPERKQRMQVKSGLIKKIVLFIPALIGFIVHAPLYIPIKKIAWKRTKSNDHYDSVMVALLLVCYPLYLLFITFTLCFIISSWWMLSMLLLFPFTAWAYVQLKPQFNQ